MHTAISAFVRSDTFTEVDTHAAFDSPVAVLKVRDGETNGPGVTLFFDDLAHVERWVRDLLGQVEVLKCESANDQPRRAPEFLEARETSPLGWPR